MNAAPPLRDQEQFLTILSRDEALERFRATLNPRPVGVETLPLAHCLGRVVALDVRAAVDAPPFDRSTVDGYALRASDIARASQGAPVSLVLTGETIACGHAPRLAVAPGCASAIATGGPMPRGADAVVMIEHIEPGDDGSIRVLRAAGPGQNLAFAGSDIALGQTVIPRGALLGSREIAMLAAVGVAAAPVVRRPRIAVISTGDELVAPGEPLSPAAIYDANGPIIAAALAESGCEPVPFGAIPDDETRLWAALTDAFATCDGAILSGGTSKGAGDLTHRLVPRLGPPGVIAHGVALKPGKPLMLAVCDGKPVVALPGFPTSAMFTFHDIVAPVLRAMAGLPARAEARIEARLAVRAPSDLGRTEFVMAALANGPDGLVAYPVGKGSGAVTAFAQADGFFAIDALADAAPAGATVEVTLFTPHLRVPDLTIMGSHCVGLDAVMGEFAQAGRASRVLALGSLAGLSALKRRECDLAPIHLLDPASGVYNQPFLDADLALIPGWRRMQGVLFRPGDDRLSAPDAETAVRNALADPECLMVNRNSGSGTRLLLDKLLAGAKPQGFWNQPRSHNSVAAAIAQGRADWGVAIAPLARPFGLGFLPLTEEAYDVAVHADRIDDAVTRDFRNALAAAAPALRDLGFTPAGSAR